MARLGGDEFGSFSAAPHRRPAVMNVVFARPSQVDSQPIEIEELSLEVDGSVGVARFPKDEEDSHTLLQRADLAMYAAKENQAEFKLYSPELDQHSKRRLGVLSGIRQALVQDEIVVHYQPNFDLGDRRVRGAEALVRWQHPERGLLPPGAFVPTVEQTGLIGPLTRHVLERAIASAPPGAGRPRDGGGGQPVGPQPARPRPARGDRAAAERLRLPPEALQLEITESMIMSDPERALAAVSRLATSAFACRSTTSAPATRRWPTCADCRSTRSRSTARSSRRCSTTRAT